MQNKTRARILWGAAITVSAVLLCVFGLLLYVKSASLFGPVNPAASKLAAKLSSAVRPAQAERQPLPDLTEPEFELTSGQEPQIPETAAEETTAQDSAEPAAETTIPFNEGKTQPEPAAQTAQQPVASAQKSEPETPVRETTRKILLYVRSPKARRVQVTGSFSKWTTRPLSRKHNRWETELYLKPGHYEYNFVIDGFICPDPLEPVSGENGSVLIVN